MGLPVMISKIKRILIKSIQEIDVDLKATYLWFDERLNFTGKGEVGIPAYNYVRSKTCKEKIVKRNNKTQCLVWVYQRNPSRIWIPDFQFVEPSTFEKSAQGRCLP